ncbi:hypothetical protein MRX96_004728 [Rhipicephalus microplus]
MLRDGGVLVRVLAACALSPTKLQQVPSTKQQGQQVLGRRTGSDCSTHARTQSARPPAVASSSLPPLLFTRNSYGPGLAYRRRSLEPPSARKRLCHGYETFASSGVFT